MNNRFVNKFLFILLYLAKLLILLFKKINFEKAYSNFSNMFVCNSNFQNKRNFILAKLYYTIPSE